jgi:thiaminase
MVNLDNVLNRYFNHLVSTGHSNDALKIFVALCMCDWKEEIIRCNYEWEPLLNKLCECLDGSSCIF